jgi:hypothetical protein
VAGIVSWGGTCAAPEQYGVYTDMLNTTLRSWFATTVGTPGTVAPPVTPTPVAVSTPVATPTTAAPVVTPPPAANPVAPQPRKIPLRLAHRCSAKACSFKVSFAGDGYVTAQLYLPLRVAERLGFAGSRIATATRAASGTQNLRLALPRILRHRLTHAVRARLRVVATTADGGHSTATKAVILRP